MKTNFFGLSKEVQWLKSSKRKALKPKLACIGCGEESPHCACGDKAYSHHSVTGDKWSPDRKKRTGTDVSHEALKKEYSKWKNKD